MSHLPQQIKYQGQLYKLAQGPGAPQAAPSTPHARCKPDASGRHTHWNEKQKKCLPLPGPGQQGPNLRRMHRHAMNWTSHVTLRQPKPEHMGHHMFAATAHRVTADALHKAGFHELAAKHRTVAAKHEAAFGKLHAQGHTPDFSIGRDFRSKAEKAKAAPAP